MLIVIVGRILWSKVKKLWEQAKQGGAILTEPKTYLKHAFLPARVSSVLQDRRDRDLPRCLRHPGDLQLDHVGLRLGVARERRRSRRAPSASHRRRTRSLWTCCDVPKATAVDYSTAQQLITTGWNQVVALILVITIFGWTGGKHPRHDVVQGREGPGSRHEGAACREEGGEEGGQGSRAGRRATAAVS